MAVGDLLGPVLVDRVVVAGDEGVVVAECDLLLAGIAFTLHALAVHARTVHAPADVAQQRFHPGRGVDGVVDVVVAGFGQISVAGRPGGAVGVVKHHELQLGSDESRQPARRQPVSLGAQHAARSGRHRITAVPMQVGHHQRGPGQPWQYPQRGQIGAHHHIPVAGVPTGHPIALDGVHLGIHGQQIVTALGAVLGDLLGEQSGRHPFSGQPALHVGERDDDGVDLIGRHQPIQLTGAQQTPTPPGTLSAHMHSSRVLLDWAGVQV